MPENCFDIPASERGSFFFRIEQSKQKHFICSGFLKILNYTVMKENWTDEIRISVRHLIKSIWHQQNMQSLFWLQTLVELFSLTSVTDIKVAYFVGVSNGCSALKILHVFYEEDIRENKISRWKISIFKFIILKFVKGSRYSR